MWWAFSSGTKSYRHSFQACKSGADGISQEVCGGWEMCRYGSAPFVEHKSHLSQIRTGAALVHFDVRLGGGLGGVQRGGTGQIAGAQTDVQGSSFEVVMKRCRSKSLYIPLSVSWHRDKGRAAVATLMVLHMGYYSKWNKSSNLTYIGDKLKASVHCSVCSIWFIVRYNRFGRSCCVFRWKCKKINHICFTFQQVYNVEQVVVIKSLHCQDV